MNVNAGPAASCQFVAHPPFWGAKVASKTTPAWQNNFAKSYLMMVVAILGVCRRARRPVARHAVVLRG
jgi:hypothetical protein